ncbi:MAG: YqhG family protein [Candidatus Cohnella colombiensis]|uniref:YqhG family protein n=1 Tax=Candidatus Cohnella colombiensis TaxID=3121368 RepID=A0AA95F251_9BACL|nr:MAG: YqhG family protein [Cohnella sp.]
MNNKQVHKFVLSYLDITGCQIIEKSPQRVTVKLSPDADRMLTNRPFYWSFVDRTGAAPETLTYAWSFQAPQASSGASSPLSYLMTPSGRVVQEELYFGSRRLGQLFDVVRQGARCVTLFEEPPKGLGNPLQSHPYTAWLGVNFKVSFECDMKREELYEWGISLATGVIEEQFMERLRERKLTPRLPSNIHLMKNGLSLRKGMQQLEQKMERKLKSHDFTWAIEAENRRQDELNRIQHYYDPMLERCESIEQRQSLSERFEQRKAEIDWQYRPRVTLSTLNCGIFHLPGIH